jgi:hypothetical protein
MKKPITKKTNSIEKSTGNTNPNMATNQNLFDGKTGIKATERQNKIIVTLVTLNRIPAILFILK